MNTVAIRFGSIFSQEYDTIKKHQEIIDELGYAWFGMLGSSLSNSSIEKLKREKTDRILLIDSKTQEIYWAMINEITQNSPDIGVSDYYKDFINQVGTWFKVTGFEKASMEVLTKCKVTSLSSMLADSLKSNLKLYFRIEFMDEKGK